MAYRAYILLRIRWMYWSKPNQNNPRFYASSYNFVRFYSEMFRIYKPRSNIKRNTDGPKSLNYEFQLPLEKVELLSGRVFGLHCTLKLFNSQKFQLCQCCRPSNLALTLFAVTGYYNAHITRPKITHRFICNSKHSRITS